MKTTIERVLSFIVIVVASGNLIFTANSYCAGTPKAPPRSSKPTRSQTTEDHGPVFSFQTQTGAVNEALKKIIQLRYLPVETTEEESRKISEMAQAKGIVRRESAAAAHIIVDNLRKLAPDDVTSHATLFSLLYLVAQEDTAIQYFQEVAMTGPVHQIQKPRSKNLEPDQPVRNHYEVEDPYVLIRYMAMSGLSIAARHGDRRAIEAILTTLKSPHREVKMTAVRYYYALSKSRLRAKTQMRERLTTSDQYLLNLY